MEQARNHSHTEANPVKTPAPAIGGAPVAAGDRRLTPERIASKTPTGLPAIDRERYAQREHGDPVRRAASRIVTLDNANMGASDSCVDVDGKSFDAHRDAPLWHDNEIHSNASLDDSVVTADDGLAGFASRRGDGSPAVETRLGWQVSAAGIIDAGRTYGARTERVIRLEPSDAAKR
ncbi:DUF3005 domain-containing protein [Burkholderia sp. 3C]